MDQSAPGPRLGPVAAGRCRRRIHLDNDPSADRSLRTPPDPGLLLRQSNLADHRRQVHDLLVAQFGSDVDLDVAWSPDQPDRPPLVWGAHLRSATRYATPDLLIRAADDGYVPILVRGHRTLDPGSGALCSDLGTAPMGASGASGAGGVPAGPISPAALLAPSPSPTRKARSHHVDALALAHVYRLLAELGLASTRARGGVIGFGGPAGEPDWDDGAVIVWHDLGATGPGPSALADYDVRFADRLAVAAAAAAGRPALAFPSRVAECRRCPWWPVCEPELRATHDVSLLVAGADVEVLHARGLTTYDQLADLDPAAAAALPLTGIPPGDAHARALALIAEVPMVRRGPRLAPPRADVEIDVDMESYLDDGAYLWGTYLTSPSGWLPPEFEPGYRPFVTWEGLDRPAAGENFAAFWQFLTALRAACERAGRTFATYCYSRKAEERWLYGTPRRFPDVDGMPDKGEIDRFCRSGEWVDLYAEVKRCFVVPGSLRLKKVATVAGFAWRDPEPSGENSMAWYRIATGGDGHGGDGHAGDGHAGDGHGGDGHGGGGCGAAGPAAPEPTAGRAGADDGDGSTGPGAVAANRDRILRYNEDDVRATLALRRWMTDRAGELPTVADLEAGVRAGA